MELPAGVNPINVSDGDRRRNVLKLNKSLYGLKQAVYNWFKKLHEDEGLITHDFIQSQVNKCVFCRKDCIVLTYVDDCIILGKDMAIVDAVISSLKEGHEDFELVDQCNIDKYLGLLIRDIDVNIFKMSQSFLSLDEKIRRREETLMLGSLCLIVTWTVYLGNTHGYILEGLECSGILLTVFDLRFKWQCIKPLVSRLSQ